MGRHHATTGWARQLGMGGSPHILQSIPVQFTILCSQSPIAADWIFSARPMSFLYEPAELGRLRKGPTAGPWTWRAQIPVSECHDGVWPHLIGMSVLGNIRHKNYPSKETLTEGGFGIQSGKSM